MPEPRNVREKSLYEKTYEGASDTFAQPCGKDDSPMKGSNWMRIAAKILCW
jgi:hypothetical protein